MGKGGAYMSKIDDLMKQLAEKKITIEAYNLIADSLGKTLEDKKFDQVREDVSGKIAEFIIGEIEAVEETALASQTPQAQTPQSMEGFSPEDLGLLKALVDRAKGKNVQQRPQSQGAFDDDGEMNPQPPPRNQQRKPNNAAPDKIKFALQNRHLEGKTVIFQGQNGMIEGVVRGLDAPKVVVQTATGKNIDVPIDQIEVKGA